MIRNRSTLALIALDCIVAVTAIGGGIALVGGLEGARFPLTWLRGTPFTDYVGPGVILASVGGVSAVAAATLVRGARVGPRASLVAGLVLVGWIAGEVALVSADNVFVSPMELLYLLTGVAMVGLALRAALGADFRAGSRS